MKTRPVRSLLVATAAAASLLALVTCTGKEGPARGGLVLVLADDGSLGPDRVKVAISSRGQTLHQEDYAIPPTQLPNTISIVSNGSTTDTAEITISAFRGGVAVDRRDAIVRQIPTDRVVALRVILSARCTPFVTPDASSTCGEKKTCDPATARCVTSEVDAANLPAYDGTANDGQDTGTSDSTVSDSGADVVDAGLDCDPTKPFSAGRLVPGLPAGGLVGDPRLSQSELTAYYSLNTLDSGFQVDMYTATRATPNDAFSNITPISAVNSSTLNDFAPTVNAMESTLIFARSSSVGVLSGLFISTRGSSMSAFTSATPLAGSLGTANIRDPYLTPDGTILFYANAVVGGLHIYQSTLTAGVYPKGSALPELETAAGEYRPVVSADLRSIYWASARTDLTPAGKNDIYMATRPGRTGPFTSLRNVSELNTSRDDFPGWISPDNCRLYFWRDDGILVASREQR